MGELSLLQTIRESPPESSAARQAVDELLREHMGWLERLCIVDLRNEEEALDCLQEVLIQIARSLRSFRGDSKLTTWMYRIAKRTIARLRRKRALERVRFVLGASDDTAVAARVESTTEESLLQSEEQQRVLDAMRTLPEKQRHAMMLYYFEDCSLRDIAGTIGCAEATVKTHLARGRAAVKVFLES